MICERSTDRRGRAWSRALAAVVMVVVLGAVGVALGQQPATPHGADTAKAMTAPSVDGDFDMGALRRELGAPVGAGAADSVAMAAQAAAPKPENLMVVVLRIAGYLALILGTIVVVGWLLKKGGIAGGSRLGGGSMDVLEALSLGPNRSIVLVRVTDSVLLIAQTPTSISVLEKFDGQKAAELVASSKGIVSMTKFKDALSMFLGKQRKQ